MNAIAGSLSASIEDVPALVARQAEHLRESEQTTRRLERELATFRARALFDGARPSQSGVRLVEIVGAQGTMDDLRVLAQAAAELPSAVLVASLAAQPTVLVATSADSGIDAGRMLKEALAAVGGRGGGSPRMAQGSASADRLAELHRALAAAITGAAGPSSSPS